MSFFVYFNIFTNNLKKNTYLKIMTAHKNTLHQGIYYFFVTTVDYTIKLIFEIANKKMMYCFFKPCTVLSIKYSRIFFVFTTTNFMNCVSQFD